VEKRSNLLKKRSTVSFQIIIFGFLLLIVAGSLILMLPIASADRSVTPFSDTVFTAVSAVCVTGLVTVDTATHWSVFGQAVLLVLIQIGGMGVITIGLAIIRITGRKIGLWQRSTMQESISAPQVGGIIRLTSFIIRTSAIIEACGAALLMPVFIADFGVGRGIWYSFFHSISAFCNAGFDLMGVRQSFSSLTSYADNVYVNIVVMLLIIIGGISFMTWDDFRTNKLRFKKFSLQSKIILITSAILIVVPAVYLFFFEFGDKPVGIRILYSFFQSVTTRTAGFNTADLDGMNDSGKLIMTALMLIGGSPGSTAGGMKTTTVAVLFLSALTVFRRRDDVEAFRRRIPDEAVRNAGAILFMYLALFFTAACAISLIEGLPLITCLFETGSAIGTVGLTLGITPSLSIASRIILMVLMFSGRVGGLTLIYAALPSRTDTESKLPLERISIG
jgi:trk system potassium uptake protein TrkH